MDTIAKSSVLEKNTSDFLSGGGEMGERIRMYDWASSSVGKIDTWPQSLLTSLSIILNSKFPMFIWWGKDLIQFYNDAYRPSLGKDAKHPNALGQKGAECWPEIWPVIKPLIDQVLSGGESTWSENQLIPIYRNGKLEDVYWTFSYSPIKIESGKIGGVLVVCNETTDAILNLKKIEESQSKLHFAIDAAELGTWDYNPFTDEFDGNARLKEWFGLSADTSIPLPLAIKVIAPEDRARIVDAIQNALQYSSGGNYNTEYTIIHPVTGQKRIVKATGKTSFNKENQAYRFDGTLEDVTEEVLVRKQIEESEIRLRYTAERLQLALDAGQLGAYEWIIETDEMICNTQCKEHFGFLPNQTITFTEFSSRVIATDRERRKKAIDTAIKKGGTYDTEYRVEFAQGKIRWIRSFGKSVYDASGKPLKITGMTLDITEHKIFTEELEKQVKERTTELKKSNEDLLQFAHVASHDLKEPVRKVKTFCSRLQDEFGYLIPEQGQFYLGKIQHASNRMISMIDGVLTYSTLNNLDHAIEKIDLNDVISNIEKDLEILIEEKNAVIMKDKLPVIEGIPVLIYQLFYNLINNALKFSKTDQKECITISYVKEQHYPLSYAKIIIADNGIGFEEEYATSMFQAFIRLNSKDKYEGTGLGLSLCKKIVERHHGTISASGKKDVGAVFTILLPLKA